jgi:hypothetical protein
MLASRRTIHPAGKGVAMTVQTPAEVIAREFRQFVHKESFDLHTADFADHLTRRLAEAGYTIIPAPAVRGAHPTGVLRAALLAIADRARSCSADPDPHAVRREGCLEEIEALANLALHGTSMTTDPKERT